MLLYLFLGLLLTVLISALAVAFTRAEPTSLARALRWAGFGLAGAGLVLLPFIGRGSLIALGPAIILPLLIRMIVRRGSAWGEPKGGAGPRPGRTSTVRTAWLVMTLDHDSGATDGEVRAGQFAGRRLSTLELPELLTLRGECGAADPDSLTLVEAYLDRVHGADWRAQDSGSGTREEAAPGAQEGAQGPDAQGPGRRQGPAARSGGMSREEAYEVLGLAPGAPPEAIKEAHRSLMRKLHPDHGGSTYLAAKINQAKDLLLGN